MDYLDYGYNEFLTKVAPNQQGISSLAFDGFTDNLSGSKVQGGVMISNDGKVKIDLDNDTIIISDGIAERVRLGSLDDNSIGMSIKDKNGNVLMQISEGTNIIQSGNKIFQIDIDNQRFLFNDEKGNPQAVFGMI